MAWPGLINYYKKYLPVSDNTPIITLKEGQTPLIFAESLSEKLNANIFLKYEGLNPTGSFKDRGMTMAISKAVEDGAQAVLCASTGNTSASMAAYAAKAKIKGYILVPDGNVALGKLSQAIACGSTVLPIKGNFDRALEIGRDICEKFPVTLVNSVNPYRIDGQQTGAFEIIDDLENAPDILSLPVGNAGNITAYWKGFKAYREDGKSSRLPRMWGTQAEGSAPIVYNRKFDKPETIATAIRIGNPASWEFANNALKESEGRINAVTDEEILEAYTFLSKNEGVFCEPASAASVAGLFKSHKAGELPAGALIVCILTGHGLKDPTRAIDHHTAGKDLNPIDAEMDVILKAMGF